MIDPRSAKTEIRYDGSGKGNVHRNHDFTPVHQGNIEEILKRRGNPHFYKGGNPNFNEKDK